MAIPEKIGKWSILPVSHFITPTVKNLKILMETKIVRDKRIDSFLSFRGAPTLNDPAAVTYSIILSQLDQIS